MYKKLTYVILKKIQKKQTTVPFCFFLLTLLLKMLQTAQVFYHQQPFEH